MFNRPLFAASAVAAAVLGCALSPTGTAAATKPVATFGTASITPKQLSASGGAVNITVKITPRANVTITSVTVHSTVPGSKVQGGTGTLTPRSGNLYSGTVSVPANPKKAKNTSTISATVVTSGGNKTAELGTVKVQPGSGTTGGDGSTPPGPPPI